jgi:stalled ribosome rescue protein Dom34
MSAYVVWMDLDEAKVFKLVPAGKERRILRRTEIRHHTSADPENHKKEAPFFAQVRECVADASELLLLGPGATKDHFRSYLAEKDPAGVGGKIVGSLTVDHPTDNQILAESRRFFKVHDLYA